MEKMTYEQWKINNKIDELKRKLGKTDYKAIKYAEGELTEEEYSPIREERRAWRAEINSLEMTLIDLKVQPNNN